MASASKCASCGEGSDAGSQRLRCSRCELVFYCGKEFVPPLPYNGVLARWILSRSGSCGCAGRTLSTLCWLRDVQVIADGLEGGAQQAVRGAFE